MKSPETAPQTLPLIDTGPIGPNWWKNFFPLTHQQFARTYARFFSRPKVKPLLFLESSKKSKIPKTPFPTRSFQVKTVTGCAQTWGVVWYTFYVEVTNSHGSSWEGWWKRPKKCEISDVDGKKSTVPVPNIQKLLRGSTRNQILYFEFFLKNLFDPLWGVRWVGRWNFEIFRKKRVVFIKWSVTRHRDEKTFFWGYHVKECLLAVRNIFLLFFSKMSGVRL